MAVTLTYDPVLSRVRINATAVGTSPDAIVERSLDGITWVTVRGGGSVQVVAGALALPVDDYEFAPDVLNTYRVRTLGAVPVLVGVGASSHATAPATTTPAFSTAPVAGDLIVLMAGASTGGVATPDLVAGYTSAVSGPRDIQYKVAVGGDAAPVVSYTGVTAGDSISARVALFRGAAGTLDGAVTTLTPGAGQPNLPYPGYTPVGPRRLVLASGWMWDDWTGIDVIDGFADLGAITRVTGHDMGMSWNYQVQGDTPTPVPAGAWTTTGNATELTTASLMAWLPNSVTSQTDSITPVIGGPWLKSINRPFLNQAVDVCRIGTISRASRSERVQVIERPRPVVQSTVRGSRRYAVTVTTHTEQQEADLDALLASGDLLLLQMPDADRHPTMYVDVDTTALDQWYDTCSEPGTWTLPMIEVDPPASTVVGATATWQTVIDTYATWADVILAHPTWADVLELVASPDEIVP